MAVEINKNNNFNIEYWMCSELDLDTLGEVAAFALIYSYSKNNQEFFGSVKYVAKWCKCSEVTAVGILKKLTEKGYILKSLNMQVGYISKYKYKVNMNIVKDILGAEQC